MIYTFSVLLPHGAFLAKSVSSEKTASRDFFELTEKSHLEKPLEPYRLRLGNRPVHMKPALGRSIQWDADLGMYFLRARYNNVSTGRFHNMDTYEGRGHTPLSLHKYLYTQGNPVNFTDPSGNVSLSNITATIRTLGSKLFTQIRGFGNGVLRALKTKRWNIWWVKTPPGRTFEHTFIWAQQIGSRGKNIGYHVKIFERTDRARALALLASRNTGLPVPGAIFLITPQRQMNKVFGVTLPIEERRISGSLGNIAFAVWNLYAAQTMHSAAIGAGHCSTFRPFKYVTDVTSCISWSDQAARKAAALSLLPF